MSPTRRIALATAAATAAAAAAGGYAMWQRNQASLVRSRRLEQRDRERQTIGEGTGPLFFRRYQIDVANPVVAAAEWMAQIQADPQLCTPSEIARFEKTHGETGRMAVGDRFYIHITGPWDGPVEATRVTPTAFELATLDDHMEAGRITFEVVDLSAAEPGLRFRIYSRARSHTPAVDLAYRWAHAAQQGQTYMWTQFCREASRLVSSAPPADVDVRTFQAPYADPMTTRDAAEMAPHQGTLADLAARALNFDADSSSGAPPAGWNHDDDRTYLIAEPPGPPLENGSFARATQFVRAYRFPNPKRVRGVFDPDSEMEGRTMLLDARFAGFRFPFGVRISRTLDETRTTPEGDEHVWGYSYRTLEGHFERGEITFEIVKREWSGRVYFRVHSFSKRARIPNIVYRIGFGLLGRTLQRRFALQALDRTRAYVRQSLVRDACLRDDPTATALLLDDRTEAIPV